jgi:hypothetical protein
MRALWYDVVVIWEGNEIIFYSLGLAPMDRSWFSQGPYSQCIDPDPKEIGSASDRPLQMPLACYSLRPRIDDVMGSAQVKLLQL